MIHISFHVAVRVSRLILACSQPIPQLNITRSASSSQGIVNAIPSSPESIRLPFIFRSSFCMYCSVRIIPAYSPALPVPVPTAYRVNSFQTAVCAWACLVPIRDILLVVSWLGSVNSTKCSFKLLYDFLFAWIRTTAVSYSYIDTSNVCHCFTFPFEIPD